MASRLTDEQIESNKSQIDRIIDSFPMPRKGLVMEMLAGPVGLEYFTAPGSTRESYHACYPGGLADHSLRVARTLVELAQTLAPKRFSHHQLLFIGLFHDLGKAGDGEEPFYKLLEGPDNLWRRRRGELYGTNKDLVYMPTCDRTIFVLNRYGIRLSAEEFQAIRISDGQYEKANTSYSMQETDLALLLHFADRWACSQEKLLG